MTDSIFDAAPPKASRFDPLLAAIRERGTYRGICIEGDYEAGDCSAVVVFIDFNNGEGYEHA